MDWIVSALALWLAAEVVAWLLWRAA